MSWKIGTAESQYPKMSISEAVGCNTKSFSKHFRQVFVESACESTIHGIPHFFRRKNWLIRLVWAACFLVSTAVCAWMIAETIISYFQYDTVTKSHRVYLATTEFPTVSICNVNPFMTNKSYEIVESILVENHVLSPAAAAVSSPFDYFFEDILRFLKFLVGTNVAKELLPTKQELNKTSSEEFLRSLGYDIKDMLLSCTYDMKDCSTNDFDWYFDTFYGNCWRFNSGKYANGSEAQHLKTTRAGRINGLNIELFLYEPKNVLSLASSTGIHVHVHNKSMQPLFFTGTSVPTGSQTNLQVGRIFSSYLPSPYSDCLRVIDETHPSPLVRALLSKGYTYTQQNCFLACYQNYTFQKCNCYNVVTKLITNTPMDNIDGSDFAYCLNITQVRCDTDAYEKFFAMDVQSMCGDLCPLECDRVTYNIYMNAAEYPSPIYASSLMANPKIREKYAQNMSELTYESLKRNMIQIAVYYGDLSFEKFDEVEYMGVTDLVSNIGGTLGLFLGMSFLSFIEILDIFLQMFD